MPFRPAAMTPPPALPRPAVPILFRNAVARFSNGPRREGTVLGVQLGYKVTAATLVGSTNFVYFLMYFEQEINNVWARILTRSRKGAEVFDTNFTT